MIKEEPLAPVGFTEKALIEFMERLKTDWKSLQFPADNPPVPLWLYERLQAGDPEAERIYAEGVLRYRMECGLIS